MDRSKYQYEGMKWLAELELLDHPQLINTLKLNIFSASKHVKEVELLIYRENKSMLVLLELSWIGQKFYKKGIFLDVQEILTQLLPSFRFRVVSDPKIMDMAVAKVKQALTGGKYENSSSNPSSGVLSEPNQPVLDGKAPEVPAGTSEGSQPDQEKQPEAGQAVSNTTGANDPKKE